MCSQIIHDFEASQLRKDVPEFQPGDTLRVSVRIAEGDKERIQDFVGVCIRRRGDGIRETFTVRRVSYGVGMERIFPLHSPKIEKIKVTRHGRVRRAKLYYLRELRGRKARIAERKGIETSRLGLAPTGEPEVLPTAEAPAAPETPATN
jgi:large subunit ribosomal protein L19